MTELDDRDREIFAEYERAALAERDARWERIVPARFAAARIDDLDDATRSTLRVGFLPRKNLVLLGPVGTGKTHAAVACARQSYDAGRSVAFWPVVSLMDALRPDGTARASELVAVDLLVLDDVAVEKPSEWTTERLDLIVNGRWLDGRPTIVTSNLTPESLARGLGERVWSRIVDDALVYRVTGKDRRRG